MISLINGIILKEIIEYAYKNLELNKNIVNELNVFPVPDGDTGDNMLMTVKGGYNKIKDLSNEDSSYIANEAANGMLMSARGNSGVILSQLFYGFSKGIENKKELTITDIKEAFKEAVDIAYKAVENPTEGTILTVAREVYESIDVLDDYTTLNSLSDYLISKSNESVLNTPNLLPILKESGVVDSGGAGLYYLFEGIHKYSEGEMIEGTTNEESIKQEIDTTGFDENSHLEYGYCSEILLQLMNYKCDINNFDLEEMRSFLNSIGDSLVLVKTGSIIKIHVHTFTPHKLLEYAQQFGEFIKIKIENMTLQHSEVVIKNRFEIKKDESKDKKEFGIVSVASGDGIISLFKELGCDYVINGGQTNNPSAEDFIKAFDSVNAKNIFVLPNNSNIILTAKQAKSMYNDSNIIVIESKNIGDGYSILSMIDYSKNDPESIKEDMLFNMQSTKTSLITKSIRDTQLDGIDIKKDQYIGFSGKTMLSSNDNCIDTLKDLIDKTDDHNEIAMIIFGKDSNEQDRIELQKYIKENHKNLEYFEIDGKQDVYDYYLLIQ